MDIISRLKTYLDSQNISNSQFADTCGIPRPTLSQLLNGRNKKISDEIISKIHDTYPSLSILWLLFGEGSMLAENMRFSEGYDEDNSLNSASFPTENKVFTNGVASQSGDGINEANRKSDQFEAAFQPETDQKPVNFDFSSMVGANFDQQLTNNTEQGKRITNIVVFYSDNSFQSFKPSAD